MESYFVEEDTGKEIEAHLRWDSKSKVCVEVSVDKNGNIGITKILYN
ncbi:MAG: GDYXXLXY domain-containing protein [Candidatus Hydrogenedentota bacterium]